jgi:hypothetical protein
MTRIYSPGARGYLNVTTGVGRLLLVMTGAYLIFKPKEVVSQENPYVEYMERTEITYYSPISTEGVVTKEIKDGDTVQGARDQIQVSYRVTGTDFGKAVIKYGDTEKVIDSPQSFPISFTISKPTVIAELEKNNYLQVQISVTPASAQAEAHTMSFRYEGA